MKKIILTLVLGLYSCLNAFSQATSLTIDCQTPGWLSSMINYGDQQTVIDLTVTGYLNSVDFEFIGTLMKLHSLKRLDMEQIDVVSSDSESQDVLPLDMFKIGTKEKSYIEKIVLPLSVKKIMQSSQSEAAGCFSNYLYVDTLVMGGPAMPIIQNSIYGKRSSGGSSFNTRIKSLIIREGVDSIVDFCFPTYSTAESSGGGILESVKLPFSLKKVGKRAFYGSNISNIVLPNNIEEIGTDAFRSKSVNIDSSWKPDTLILPVSIKNYSISAFNNPSKVYYFPEGITYIDNVRPIHTAYYDGYTEDVIESNMSIEFHLKTSTPPSFNYKDQYVLKNSIVYVPKGSSERYKNTIPWSYATIIEEIPVEEVTMEKHSLSLKIGETEKLIANVYPSNADDKSIQWLSTNEEISIVDENGYVKALKGGNNWIKAISKDNIEAMDSCYVTVIQPVTGIKLDETNIELGKIGEMTQLHATVLPEDAYNKNVKWFSTNTSVCTVSSSGIVVAVGFGSSVVTATTEEGGFVAVCIVNVIDKMALYDLNGDGKISAGDIQVIINEMKKPTGNQNMKYDLNGDGKISAGDIQVIINEMKK